MLVDVGADSGFFAVPFANKMNNGIVYACDIAIEMINWMRKNLSTDLLKRVKPLKIDEVKIDLPSNIADLVYFINAYHELEEPNATLKEAYRLLKPDGKLMIIDWKKEDTPSGPPLNHRISYETVINEISKTPFINTIKKNILPYHYFIISKK